MTLTIALMIEVDLSYLVTTSGLVVFETQIFLFPDSSPCCGQINITADAHHGVWMIHFNKLVTGNCTMIMSS